MTPPLLSLSNSDHKKQLTNYSWNLLPYVNETNQLHLKQEDDDSSNTNIHQINNGVSLIYLGDDPDPPEPEPNRTKKEDFSIEYMHRFVDRCYLLTTIKPLVLTMGIINTVLFIAWIVFVFYIWKNRQFPIQKWLLLFPLSKALS